jgi:hypothetical protein
VDGLVGGVDVPAGGVGSLPLFNSAVAAKGAPTMAAAAGTANFSPGAGGGSKYLEASKDLPID